MPASTPEGRIEEALYGRVASLSTTAVKVYPNNIYPASWDSQADDLMIISHAPNPPERRRIVGGHKSRLSGILQIAVLVPIGTGSSRAIDLVALVTAHFPEDLRLASGTTELTITRYPHVAGAYEDRGRWRTPVNVEYATIAL